MLSAAELNGSAVDLFIDHVVWNAILQKCLFTIIRFIKRAALYFRFLCRLLASFKKRFCVKNLLVACHESLWVLRVNGNLGFEYSSPRVTIKTFIE